MQQLVVCSLWRWYKYQPSWESIMEIYRLKPLLEKAVMDLEV